VSRD